MHDRASTRAGRRGPCSPPWRTGHEYLVRQAGGTRHRNHYDITNLTGVTWASGATFDGTGGGGSVVVDPSYRTPPLTITAWLRPALRSDGTSPFGVLQPYPPNAFSNDQPGLYGYGIGVNVWSLADAGSASALAAEGVGPCQPPANPPQTCDVAALVDAGVTFTAGQEVFVALTVSPLGADGGAAVANVYVKASGPTTVPPPTPDL
jgi:hypothetical protein